MSFLGSASYPSVAHFPSVATYPSSPAFPVGWPLLLNVQKLSLPANTAVGTQVSVTDGFVVTWQGETVGGNGPLGVSRAGFYSVSSLTSGGKPVYLQRGVPILSGEYSQNCFTYLVSLGAWAVNDDPSNPENGDPGPAAPGNEEFPWLADWSGVSNATSSPTLTHPALQQLTAPATAQGGVFVAGGSQDGVYTARGVYNGKQWFEMIGGVTTDPFDGAFALAWDSDGSRWNFVDNSGSPLCYSLSNVTTPDLATNWKYNSDDSPASITVTSVTQGALNAGLKIGSTTYVVNGSSNGRNKYSDVLGVATDVTWNGSAWIRGITEVATGNTAFPWDADWTLALITVVRDDVASENSWEVI